MGTPIIQTGTPIKLMGVLDLPNFMGVPDFHAHKLMDVPDFHGFSWVSRNRESWVSQFNANLMGVLKWGIRNWTA